MEDRELLELAAKAAGMPPPDGFHPTAGFVWIKANDGVRRETRWNPLTDDGDALRLAVALGIVAKYEHNAPPELKIPRECGVAITNAGQWFSEAGADPCAATRRAIVRAAAALATAPAA